MNLIQGPLLESFLPVWRNPLVCKGRFSLMVGADYVALIIPRDGELFVEATFGPLLPVF